MSLLTVAQDVCDTIGLARPTAIITGTDQLARQILGHAKKTLQELGQMDWPILSIPYTFNTVANQSQYALPADWGCEIGDTAYSSARYQQVRGSLTPGDWARQRTNVPNMGMYRFRIYGLPLKINLTPTPTTVEAIVLEYQTTSRVMQLDGSYKTTYFADTDVSLVSEELVSKGLEWRVRRSKGMDYSEEFDDYELARSERLAKALTLGSMPVATRTPYDAPELGMGYVPETGFGS